MSDRGLHAVLVAAHPPLECLMVGPRVPRLHHSDGKPVYLVVDHPDGLEVALLGTGKTTRLLAYPATWSAPGEHSGAYIYARHERLKWNAPLPVFDRPRCKQTARPLELAPAWPHNPPRATWCDCGIACRRTV